MSQQAQKPSLGRVVLFTRRNIFPLRSPDDGGEFAADIVKVDQEAGVLGLHVKTTDPAQPIRVDFAPIAENVADDLGRSWRWPPRV